VTGKWVTSFAALGTSFTASGAVIPVPRIAEFVDGLLYECWEVERV